MKEKQQHTYFVKYEYRHNYAKCADDDFYLN